MSASELAPQQILSSRLRPRPVGPVGRAILEAVRQNPGIHFRALARAAHVHSAGQLRHHLDRLRRQQLMVELEDGGYKRFFAAGSERAALRPHMARFSRQVPRRIGQLLLERPMNRSELRETLGCADSTLSYHLNRMLQAGDVAKARQAHICRYSLTNHDVVRQVLATEGASLETAPAAPGPVPEPVEAPAELSAFPAWPEPLSEGSPCNA
ncbi:MAG: winged helix-turn-helix transcriptional regulator [Thermoplasmatota archaeon]